VTMGYKPAEADRALATLAQRIGAEPVPELLRAALAMLSR
jgi:Holliday junction resolvasome RuvABC DNA-binding subunit